MLRRLIVASTLVIVDLHPEMGFPRGRKLDVYYWFGRGRYRPEMQSFHWLVIGLPEGCTDSYVDVY